MTTPPTDCPWIVEVNAQNFEADVIQRSLEMPVVLDFCATWSEPCKTLSPALKRLARAAEGGFLLARVDIDSNPEIAQALRVQSVPTVLVLAGGRMVDGFQGALAEPELKQFLARFVPDLGDPPAVLEDARALARGAEGGPGDATAALALVESYLGENPGDLEAVGLLAELLLQSNRDEEARETLAGLTEEQRDNEHIKAALARMQMASGAGDLETLKTAAAEAPEDAAARTAYGKALLAAGDFEAGLEELLEAVRLNPSEKNSPAKQAMLEAFDVLGLEDELANRFRFELSLVLFA